MSEFLLITLMVAPVAWALYGLMRVNERQARIEKLQRDLNALLDAEKRRHIKERTGGK